MKENMIRKTQVTKATIIHVKRCHDLVDMLNHFCRLLLIANWRVLLGI